MSFPPRNTQVRLRPRAGYDAFGEALDAPARPAMVAVVSFSNTPTQTPARAEQSSSRGRAEIELAAAVLLFAPNDTVKLGDRVDLFGTSLEVSSVFPRADAFGRLAAGHLEVALVRRES